MMRYTQYLLQRSDRRWDSSDMQRRFDTAMEASKVIDELYRQLRTLIIIKTYINFYVTSRVYFQFWVVQKSRLDSHISLALY